MTRCKPVAIAQSA